MRLPTRLVTLALAGCLLHAASLTAPLAAQAIPLKSLAQVWDTAAVRQILTRAKGAPNSPQIVVLGYGDDGVLERFVTTDTVPQGLRELLRDSIPKYVRTEPLFAGQTVRLYLVKDNPIRIVPKCDNVQGGFSVTNGGQVEEALGRELRQINDAPRLGASSRDSVRETRSGGRGVVKVAFVIAADGRGHAFQVARTDAPMRITQAAVNGVKQYRFDVMPGRPWVPECLMEQEVTVWWYN